VVFFTLLSQNMLSKNKSCGRGITILIENMYFGGPINCNKVQNEGINHVVVKF